MKVCQELLARLEKEKKGGEEAEAACQQPNSKEVCVLACVRAVLVFFLRTPSLVLHHSILF